MGNKTGCSSGEALWAMRHPLCPEILPGIPADHCKTTNDLCKGEECQTYQDYIKGLKEVK